MIMHSEKFVQWCQSAGLDPEEFWRPYNRSSYIHFSGVAVTLYHPGGGDNPKDVATAIRRHMEACPDLNQRKAAFEAATKAEQWLVECFWPWICEKIDLQGLERLPKEEFEQEYTSRLRRIFGENYRELTPISADMLAANEVPQAIRDEVAWSLEAVWKWEEMCEYYPRISLTGHPAEMWGDKKPADSRGSPGGSVYGFRC